MAVRILRGPQFNSEAEKQAYYKKIDEYYERFPSSPITLKPLKDVTPEEIAVVRKEELEAVSKLALA